MILRFSCSLFFLVLISSVSAQKIENKAWIFLSHRQNISNKWSFLADVQFRSSDNLYHASTFFIRPAISLRLGDAHSVAIGYAYKGDWEENEPKMKYQVEHRIYQQYTFNKELLKSEFQFRLRLEQRKIREETDFKFSQRVRGALGIQIPLSANRDFTKGIYSAVQNEVFANIQNKENVNNHFFDQNRSYFAIGYRWSKKMDTEIGYYYWLQKGKENRSMSNVLQLKVSTDL